MDEQYFVISGSDGDVFIRAKSREKLKEWLEKDEDAEVYADTGEKVSFRTSLDVFNVLPEDLKIREVLIIKGRIIVPEPAETTTTYRVP